MVWETLLGALITLLQELGIVAIGAALIYAISKRAIDQYFEKSLQAHQNELERDRIRFSDLHEKRAEIVSELYYRLQDLREATQAVRDSTETATQNELINAAEAGHRFWTYYQKHRIYFPPEICETGDSLLATYRDLLNMVNKHSNHEPSSGWRVVYEAMEITTDRELEHKTQELQEELERHFRELLGVETGVDVSSDDLSNDDANMHEEYQS